MTPIADMIEQMLARGVAMDMVVVAVRAAELSRDSTRNRVDTAAEKRRAWDREYRRNRAKDRVESGGNRVDESSALSSSSPIKDSNEGKKERKRGRKIPPDWKPNENHIVGGLELGYSEVQIFEQAEDMRLWAQSNEHRAVARKSDWDLTFTGWLRRNKPKGKPNGQSGDILTALDKMYPGPGSAGSPSNILRLQKG